MNIKINILGIIILMLALGVKAQVPKYCTASFSYHVNNDISPLTYKFNDASTSSNAIIEWEWNFGNGETSSRQNPEHQYFAEGNYPISLKIKDQSGCMDITYDTINVVAVVPPSCNAFFTYLRDTIAANYTYIFFDHSIHTSDSIISWAWDFGDSSPISQQQNPTHQYSSTGSYNVSLNIVTALSCNSSYSTNLIITSGGVNCKANYTYSIDTISGLSNTLLFLLTIYKELSLNDMIVSKLQVFQN
jgi:PKD repeat protein